MAFTLDDSNFNIPEMSEADIPNLRDVLFSLGDETAQNVGLVDANQHVETEDEEDDAFDDNVEDSIIFDSEEISEDDEADEADEEEVVPNLNHLESDDGRIKVFLRIRPVENISPNYIVGEKTLIVGLPPKYKNPTGRNNLTDIDNNDLFNFTSILNCASQQLVFETCALPLLKSFIGGNNSLLFTYGITSSGKSFTMKGTATNPGLIPISLITFFSSLNNVSLDKVPDYKPIKFADTAHLTEMEKAQENEIRNFVVNQVLRKGNSKQEMLNFSNYSAKIEEDNLLSIKALRSQFNHILASTEVSCGIWISYYEIYNEAIFDLLDIDVAGEKKSRLVLQKDDSGNNFIKGLRRIFVTSAAEAYSIFLFGQRNLQNHISSTSLNAQSSRSHSSFNLTFVNVNYHKNISTTSNLCFCDLAGAERTNKTHNTGIRLKESSKINNSLMLLNRCIASLKSKQSGSQMAVSYRDSKLTQVFQPYLSSNGGGTYIISNLNPSQHLFDESYFALNFCDNATSIQQRKVAKNVRRLTQKFFQNIQRSAEKQQQNLNVIRSTVNNVSLTMDEAQYTNEEVQNLRAVVEQLSKSLEEFQNKKFQEEMSMKADMVKMMDNMTNQFKKTISQKEQETEQAIQLCDKRTAVITEYYKSQMNKLNEQIATMQSELFTKDEEFLEATCQLERYKNQISLQEHSLLQEKSEIESSLQKKIVTLEQQNHEMKSSFSEKIKSLELEKTQVESLLRETIKRLEHENSQLESSLLKRIECFETEKKESESSLLKRIESLETEKKESESSLLKRIECLETEKKESESSLLKRIECLETEKKESESSLLKRIECLETEKKESESSLLKRIEATESVKLESNEKICELLELNEQLSKDNSELSNCLAKKEIQLRDRATDLDSMQIRITNQQQEIENIKSYQQKIKNQEKLIYDLEKQCHELQDQQAKENDSSKQQKIAGKSKKKKPLLDASSFFDLNCSDLTQEDRTNTESEILNLFSARKDPKSTTKLQLSIRKKMPTANDSNSSLSPCQLAEIGNNGRRYNTRRRNCRKLF